MRLGRSITAVAGPSVITMIGVFLGLSPWFAGLNHGGPWSLATKTDFWSGLGLVVVGLVGIGLYQRGIVRELQAAGVLSRPVRLEDADEDPSTALPVEAASVTDTELLRLASTVVREVQESAAGAGRHAASTANVLEPHEPAALSEEELVQLATQLLAEIQETRAVGVPESAAAAPTDTASRLALMSEPELARMAADLLQEIHQSQRTDAVRAGEARHE